MKITPELHKVIIVQFGNGWNQDLLIRKFFTKNKQAKKQVDDAFLRIKKLQDQIDKIRTKITDKFGISVFSDGEYYVSSSDRPKFFAVSRDKDCPSSSMVLGHIAKLPHKDAIAYLKSIGIDWS